MQIIKKFEDIESLQENRIIGGEYITFKNSEIRFEGKGNILYCGKNVTLVNSQLKFMGDNCVIFLSSNRHAYQLDVTVYRNSTFFIGRNNYTNGTLHAILSEQKNIIIGKNNLFSFGVWIRTADPHLVYSIETKQRINPSKSVLIGDRVWIGQGALVLKGSEIGSGSILGAMSVCAGKRIPSNTSWAGNPARQIGEGIFWSGKSVHSWGDEETQNYQTFDGEPYIFKEDEETVKISDIDEFMKNNIPIERVRYLKSICKIKATSRFAKNPEE